MNPKMPKEQIKAFLDIQILLSILLPSFLSSQNVSVSNNGGKISAKHDDENAPTREMNKSNFGTEIATRTVGVGLGVWFKIGSMREFWEFRGKIMGISQKCSKIAILGIRGFFGDFRGFQVKSINLHVVVTKAARKMKL